MTLLDVERPTADRALVAEKPSRRVDVSRLRGAVSWWSLAAAGVAALAQTVSTVVAGRLAERPTGLLVAVLAFCVVGAALLDTAGRAAWSGVVDRAEGRLRADLLDAALHQPLAVLSEQAVGEVLDRVDDDTHELGMLLRRMVWDLLRTLLRAGPMWVVAGLTWWPAWLLFPLVGAGTVLLVRPLTAEVAKRKFAEEVAWTDHAAAMEEGVAARDDLRSSLGQAYLVRRIAELSSVVHSRVAASCESAAKIGRRAGLLLHGLLAGTALAGTFLVMDGNLSTAALVTLFLVTTSFVGQIDQISRNLPDLQAGLGALARLRTMLEAEPEPVGGLAVPAGPLGLSIRDLHFAYAEGTFALHDVDLELRAGQTLALVGRLSSDPGLAELAAEQEASLRRLVSGPPPVVAGQTDLCGLLPRQAAVEVVTPGAAVMLASSVAHELAAAVGAAVDNALTHGGTRAWVLVEDEVSAVTVSVRDDGPGIVPGRLEQAAAQGRLGVARSIRGRVADIGGTVGVVSTPGQGTEVEMRVQR